MTALLEMDARLRASVTRAQLAWLRELRAAAGGDPDGPLRVLDLGCGPGVVSAALAVAFPGATVVAVDGDAEAVSAVARNVDAAGVAKRVRAVRLDLDGDPAGLVALGPADVVFASRVVHHLADQRGAVRRLAALLAPGGLLAIAEGGLPARYLPSDPGVGAPGLLARLAAAGEHWFDAMRAALPGSVREVDDWPGFLASAGLTVRSRSFLLDLPAPLPGGVRELVRLGLVAATERAGDRLSDDDRSALARLADPADPAGVLLRSDVFLLGVDSLHVGVSAPAG